MATRSGLILVAGLGLLARIGTASAQDFIFGDDWEASLACPAGPQATIAAAMTPGGRSTRLGTTNNFLVKVLSCGYSGNVSLTPSGAPANWSLSADPASFSLASGAMQVALVEASIPTNGDAGLVTLDVAAQALAANTVPLSANIDAADEVLIVIRDGTGVDPAAHPYPQYLYLRVGTKYRIYSDDSTADHLIHADGVPGFTHMSTSGLGLLQGQEWDEISTAPGNGHVYCHNHGYGAYDPIVVVQ